MIHVRPAILTTALLLAGTSCVQWLVAQQLTIGDAFNDGDDAGWIHHEPLASSGSPGTYTVMNGGYRIQAAASTDPMMFGNGRAFSLRNDPIRSGPFFAMQVRISDWDASLDQSFGLLARVQNIGAGTTSGYAFGYSTEGFIALYSLGNDSLSPLITTPVILDPAREYVFAFSSEVNGLTGVVYDGADPAVGIALIRSPVGTPGSGAFGLFVQANTGLGRADAIFDNFQATNVPEPSPSMALALGGALVIFGMFWGERRRC